MQRGTSIPYQNHLDDRIGEISPQAMSGIHGWFAAGDYWRLRATVILACTLLVALFTDLV